MHNEAWPWHRLVQYIISFTTPGRNIAVDYSQFNLPSRYSSVFTYRSDQRPPHWENLLSINLQLTSVQFMQCGILSRAYLLSNRFVISSPSLVNNQLFMLSLISNIRRLQAASDGITRLLLLPIGRSARD